MNSAYNTLRLHIPHTNIEYYIKIAYNTLVLHITHIYCIQHTNLIMIKETDLLLSIRIFSCLLLFAHFSDCTENR